MIDDDCIGLDATICRQNNWAKTWALQGVYALGEIDLTIGHLVTPPLISVSV